MNYSVPAVKKFMRSVGLAVAGKSPSWFYYAFNRNDDDSLTNYELEYIETNFPRDSVILNTGCGTGIIVFHLASSGFTKVTGTDLLPEAIEIANWIKTNYSFDNTDFQVDDGLAPKVLGQFDLITAMHWVFSAWMGNYGNIVDIGDASAEERVRLLMTFLRNYTPHLKPGGILILELTDAVADYRLITDHPAGSGSVGVYPIRHTPEQVALCAAANNLVILEKQLCLRYGHQPRTAYFLQRTA
jgi:SAM-dependent methyltransferase